jgi:hypothetical protein
MHAIAIRHPLNVTGVVENEIQNGTLLLLAGWSRAARRERRR